MLLERGLERIGEAGVVGGVGEELELGLGLELELDWSWIGVGVGVGVGLGMQGRVLDRIRGR